MHPVYTGTSTRPHTCIRLTSHFGVCVWVSYWPTTCGQLFFVEWSTAFALRRGYVTAFLALFGRCVDATEQRNNVHTTELVVRATIPANLRCSWVVDFNHMCTFFLIKDCVVVYSAGARLGVNGGDAHVLGNHYDIEAVVSAHRHHSTFPATKHNLVL